MQNRHKLILLITLILLFGFSAVSFLMYSVSKQSIQEAIILNELPLTGDSLYAEIQKDLVRSIDASAMIASNTFLKDWVVNGEKNELIVKKYLVETKRQTHALASFFISDKTKKYYSSDAETKQLLVNVKSDAWYFKARSLNKPYQINLDRNERYGSQLAIFVNYLMYDDNHQYMGIAGVGIQYDAAKMFLKNYEQRFKRKVYFVDKDGIIMLANDPARPLGANINDLAGIKSIKFDANNTNTRIQTYQLNRKQHYVIVRYIAEMQWYLMAEKSETEALFGITSSLYENLLLCLMITALVVALTHIALKRYHLEVESAAAIDKTTALPNRKAFDIGMGIILQESERNKSGIGIILLDLDYFKMINDQHGHAFGDQVLKGVADRLRKTVRAADFICRWGGEEFLIVVHNCSAPNLLSLAENVRTAIKSDTYKHEGSRISVSASLGVALRISDETIEHLIVRADKALYQAKNAGRNQTIMTT